MGLTTHFHKTWAELQLEDVMSWRELEWQIMASHSFVKWNVDKPYKCLCCNKQINMHGDHPSMKTKNGRREWQTLHFAQGDAPFPYSYYTD